MQWFSTAKGICRFDGETCASYPESAHLASGPGPTAIGPDSALWYGTAKGATRFDGEDWITYTTADGLAANYVLDIVVGPEGAMWFATNGGISRFDGDSWTSFTTADGLAHKGLPLSRWRLMVPCVLARRVVCPGSTERPG